MSLRLFVPAEGYDGNTVAAIIDRYLAAKTQDAQAGLITADAVVQSERYLSRFAGDFGHLSISECRRTDVKDYITNHPEYRSSHTKQNAAAQIVACFRWAEAAGLIERCPYARPRELPACEPRCPITEHEVRLILLTIKTHHYRRPKFALALRLAVWFLWETGCRTCEMRLLKWEHYDDAAGCFVLPGKTTKKTGAKRRVVLTTRAWRLIRWLRRVSIYHGKRGDAGRLPADQPTGHVFTNSAGEPWDKNQFARRFAHYRKLAGVRPEVSAYSLRHGFCVRLVEAGAGERQIADLMGHSSTAYVRWYGRGAKNNVDYLRQTANRGSE